MVVEFDHEHADAEVVEEPPVEDGALRVGPCEADEDDGLARDGRGDGRGLFDRAQTLRRRAPGPVPGGHRVARPGKVPRHAPAHRAETDKGDFTHFPLPFEQQTER